MPNRVCGRPPAVGLLFEEDIEKNRGKRRGGGKIRGRRRGDEEEEEEAESGER